MMSCHLWVLSEEVAKLFLKTRSRRSPKKLLDGIQHAGLPKQAGAHPGKLGSDFSSRGLTAPNPTPHVYV